MARLLTSCQLYMQARRADAVADLTEAPGSIDGRRENARDSTVDGERERRTQGSGRCASYLALLLRWCRFLFFSRRGAREDRCEEDFYAPFMTQIQECKGLLTTCIADRKANDTITLESMKVSMDRIQKVILKNFGGGRASSAGSKK